jgi:hypothetical protein
MPLKLILHEHHCTCHFTTGSSKLILLSGFIYFFGLPLGQHLLYQNDIYFWRTGFVFIQIFFIPIPRIWLSRVCIIPALQSTPTFALHFSAPWISSCHSWTPNVFTLTAKHVKKKEFFIIILLMHLVTIQTKSKVVLWRTAFHSLSWNTVISSHW